MIGAVVSDIETIRTHVCSKRIQHGVVLLSLRRWRWCIVPSYAMKGIHRSVIVRACAQRGSIRALVHNTNTQPMSRKTPFQMLKRFVTSSEDSDESDGSSYECRTCDAQFDRQHPVCPDCGHRSIEATDWEVPEEDITQIGGKQ